jgi:alpha-1,2-mannosyltransferase
MLLLHEISASKKRSLARAGVVLFVGALLVLLIALWLDRDKLTMLDLGVYRWGGSTAFSSDELYSTRFDDYLPFTYPPIAAILFAPLAWVPIDALRWALIVGNALLVPVLGWIAVSAMARNRGHKISRESQLALVGVVSAICLFVEPVQQTIRFGQINLILAVLILVDLCLPDSSRWKGIGVGLASGIKLTPLIFVAYLLCSGRFRATVVALATFASTIAVGFVVLPSESSTFWIDRVFLDSDRVGTVSYISNQSLHGFVARTLGEGDQATLWWLVVAAVVGSVGFGAAVMAARQGRELLGVLLCALTGLMVSPISWSHHWVWIVPLATAAVYSSAFRLDRRIVNRAEQLMVRRDVVLLTLVALAIVGISVRGTLNEFGFWFAPNSDGQWNDWTFWQAIYGNAYVWAGLIGVAAGALTVTRRGRTRDRSVEP